MTDSIETRLAKLEATILAKIKTDDKRDELMRQDMENLKREIKKLNDALSKARGIWFGIGISAAVVTYFITQSLDFIKSKF